MIFIEFVWNTSQKNIVHRDLKLGNMVLNTRSRRVTITNFCLGKHLSGENDLLKDQRGSPAYISPDVLSGSLPPSSIPSDGFHLYYRHVLINLPVFYNHYNCVFYYNYNFITPIIIKKTFKHIFLPVSQNLHLLSVLFLILPNLPLELVKFLTYTNVVLKLGRPYLGKPSDMWALGVLLYTMLYGQFPFYDNAPQELFRKIKAVEYSIPE